MTMNEKQGAAEWLRGIIDEYKANERSCHEKAKMFGIDCNHEKSCTDCEIDKMKAIADRIDAEMVELPKDMDGVPIHIGDTAYLYNGFKAKVKSIEFNQGEQTVIFTVGCNGFYPPSAFTHTRPDSWEKLDEDAEKTACDYALAPRDENGLTTCDGCRFQKGDCYQEMMFDVLARAKKLAGIEEEARND